MIRGVSDVLRIHYKLDPKAALRSEVRPQQQLLGVSLPSFFPPPTPQPAPPAAPPLLPEGVRSLSFQNCHQEEQAVLPARNCKGFS